jgi:UDP-N-acetylmuramoyl-L-alanyl-D-glutamate--2,6-diaminopimelate ligase
LVPDDNPRGEFCRHPGPTGAASPASERTGSRSRWPARRHRAGHGGVESADDLLLIAGKGHETGQTIKGVTHPFDDAEVAREFAEAVT